MTVPTYSPGQFDHILANPFTAEATVIADSISVYGVRCLTIQEKFWRPVLAERNTHKNQYGNSASSRAIPVEKSLKKFMEEPAFPTSWPAEQPGMQGGAELQGIDLDDAMALWEDVRTTVGGFVGSYLEEHPDKATRLHKSVLNRLLEFGQWHIRVTTATAWDNFLVQRTDTAAQPEIRDVALLIQEAISGSTPQVVRFGEWHLPYIRDEDKEQVGYGKFEPGHEFYPNAVAAITAVSAARCARTSYETQAGVRDMDEDLNLFDRLITQQMAKGDVVHWSPLEHVATPDDDNQQREPLRWFDPHTRDYRTFDTRHLPKVGALYGWRNMRTELEARYDAVTFR